MSQTGSVKLTKAFCCNCKEMTPHQYHHFGKKPHIEAQTKPKGFWVGVLAVIAQIFMADAPTGDHKCKVCGTYLSTPDGLD